MSASPIDNPNDLGTGGPGEQRLAHVVETMRELSRQTDPQAMVRVYGERVRQVMRSDRFVSPSRRDLPEPKYRITRSSLGGETINPWTQRDRLPVYEGGLLGRLIYGDEPVILESFEVADDDPARAVFAALNDRRYRRSETALNGRRYPG